VTREFVLQTRAYHAVSAAERGARLSALLAAAKARQDLLATLIEEQPLAVLRARVPAGLRAALPASVQPFVEQEVAIEGSLEAWVEDGKKGHRFFYFLQSSGERLALHFAGAPPTLPTGTVIRVQGVRVQNALALEGATTSVETVKVVLPNTFGEQRTLVILVDFQDKATQPYTLSSDGWTTERLPRSPRSRARERTGSHRTLCRTPSRRRSKC
jgi:hypothetical protein